MHQLVEHAIGADIIDGQVRMLHGEELDWEQADIRFRGHRIGLHIIALSSGVVTTRDANLANAIFYGTLPQETVSIQGSLWPMSFVGAQAVKKRLSEARIFWRRLILSDRRPILVIFSLNFSKQVIGLPRPQGIWKAVSQQTSLRLDSRFVLG